MGSLVSRKQKALLNEEIERIASVYHAYKNKDLKEYEDFSGFCKVTSIEEVKSNDYKLIPGYYVGTEVYDEDEVPFEERINELT